QPQHLHSASDRVQRGFDIAPVDLDLAGKNRALVGLGSYLVNGVALCNDCHTCPTYLPGHNPYDGVGDGAINSVNHLGGGVPFGPNLSPPKIPPDASGKPAGLTRSQFKELIRSGHEPGSTEVL